MATCAVADEITGVLSVTATPPAECTGVIVLSVEDYNSFAQAAWWNGLSLEDGAQISGAILAVWLVGWVARQVARVLFINEERKEEA